MAGLKDLAQSRAALLNFDPRKLRVKSGLNARDLGMEENVEHVEWLAASIALEGVKSPLVVFLDGEEVFVADGHCRLAATMLAISRGADILTVPCIPEARATNDVDRVLAQNLFNSGKRLSPIEQGITFKKALALGATVSLIAERVGKSPAYIGQMIDFQGAPAEAHRLVANGSVSATLAASIIRKEGPAAGLEKIKKAVGVAKAAGKDRATAKHVAAPEDAEKTKAVMDLASAAQDLAEAAAGVLNYAGLEEAMARCGPNDVFGIRFGDLQFLADALAKVRGETK